MGTTGTAADITQLVEAHEERVRLQERTTELERLEALGRLSGGIAHDFNNLTAIILTYADFLRDEFTSADARADLDEISRAASRAADLTRQLLVFSRHDASERQLIDVNTSLEETARLLRRTLGERIDVQVQPAGRPVFVELGPGQLDQMLMNLALNARDAMPAGGRLELRLEAATPDLMRLTVADDGCGMEVGTQSRIFEPFFTTKPEGTGLGLATVFGIVTRARGQISVDSHPGVGTRFAIELPVAPEPADAAREEPVERTVLGPGTVLVVEDEPALREAIHRALTRTGLAVLTARDGNEAVETARRHHVDVLLSDVVMPGPSGPDTARAIREFQPHVIAVFMSGHTPEVIEDLGVPVLRKPFAPDDLAAAVRRALSERAVGELALSL